MKANKPSLILFFLALLCTIIFDWTEQDFFALYAKAIVLPAIFIYFLISSEFKIGKTEILIFLFCFIGQVFDLMDIEVSEIGGVICFLVVYLLLVKIFIQEHEKIKLTKKDILPVSIVIIFIVYLLVSVLSLQFDNLKKFNFMYAFYGVVLSVLSYFAFVSYITKGTHIALLMSLMAISYIFSDIFYIFNEYFSYSVVLVLIRDITQILAYFFMAEYFLEKAKIHKKVLYNN
ncbi:lysoplasmalogenase family protein [Flavobacterium piscisymbiosum]|uniref:Lysoplasmalogenase family protein n=1 Tax=Flavobacterium piscisymbiosum TaxID=2893753 RepID=A0ABS8MFY3_9FLAO|nr:lysoplasmalogenase family protein [Flavobacterium sp. F-30]MCC9064406.1 lysoplasmalogenase family protein [Flavobacterium sp. F-30]